jgi:hypothetical protein
MPKKTNYSYKDKSAPATKKQEEKKAAAKKTATQKIAEKNKTKGPMPSLGTGMAEKAKKAIVERNKKIKRT